MAVRLGDEAYFCKPLLTTDHDVFQHALQMSQHPSDGCRMKTRAIENNSQVQLGAWIDHQGDRVVRSLDGLESADSDTLPFSQGGIDRIIFKTDDAFEQGQAAWHFAPALNLYQRAVFI